jgi:uncharacterized Zn-binding protein involved in type VI secretion
MKRYYIVEGDKTTANGIVQKHTSGASTTSWQGKIISNIGDKVSCPKCKSIGIIQAVGQRKPFGNRGFLPALNNDLCICKCKQPPKLINSQTVFYEDSSQIVTDNLSITSSSRKAQSELKTGIESKNQKDEFEAFYEFEGFDVC